MKLYCTNSNNLRSGNSLNLGGLCSLSEAVLESTWHVSQVSHSSGSCCLPSDGLDTPVILPDLGGRISTRSTSLLLDVERTLATPHAKRVRLVMALTCSARKKEKRR